MISGKTAMRGGDEQQDGMFSYIPLEKRVPQDHPLRPVRRLVDEALRAMHQDFEPLYANRGRRSIAPERLLRALLLQVFYSIRSERLLIEQLDYNLLFRWFVGMRADEPVWDHSTFSKNRDRLLGGDIARRIFERVLEQANAAGLTSDEHFSVDGTLIDAWASQKSFRAKDGDDEPPEGGTRNAGRDFRGERRSNDTHESTTDPQAKLYRKSNCHPARLCYAGHVLMENRNGLLVDAELTEANGVTERHAALAMLGRLPGEHTVTLGADKGYDAREFIEAVRTCNAVPHIARNTTRNGGSSLDAATASTEGYAKSQVARKRIEESFGWGKTVGALKKTVFRGLARVGFQFMLTMAGYNLVRMRRLLPLRAA